MINVFSGKQAQSKQNFIGQPEIPSIDYNRTMRDEVHQKFQPVIRIPNKVTSNIT